jgi:TPR repeat protein
MLLALAGAALLALPGRAPAAATAGGTAAAREDGWTRQLFDSGRVDQLAGSMGAANRSAAAAVDATSLARAQRSLPLSVLSKDAQAHADAFTVSPQGGEVLALIRQIPARSGAGRDELVRKLVALARQDVPEAQTFVGLAYEYGLFGAQRSPATAREHYGRAAARRYQPAMFNLASMAYFGKGQAADVGAARERVRQAAGMGADPSGRVCGLASYIEYHRGDRAEALRFARACPSPLAHIASAAYDDTLPLDRRVSMLRDAAAAGIPDAYPLLESVTQQHAGNDRDFLACKYWLLNRLQRQARNDLEAMASECHARSAANTPPREAGNTVRAMTAFAISEQRLLDQRRRSDRSHVSWSVPFLPFRQSEVDLFEPVMKGAQ